MSANLRKFVNPKFVKTIDLALMGRLFQRYDDDRAKALLGLLQGDDAEARAALGDLLMGAEDRYPDALRADLHRIAELGTATGLEMILEEAGRRDIDLFPELKVADRDSANVQHDPKHIALRTFLEHHAVFEAAADQLVLHSVDRFASFMGPEGNVTADPTDEKCEALRAGIAGLFLEVYQGDYCRIGSYLDAGEIDFVVTHGSVVSTLPVIEGEEERIISLRSVTQSILRYDEVAGTLRMGRFKMALRQKVADLFADIVLERPDFFQAANAQDLYTLRPVERMGAAFAFRHAWEPAIERVTILGATATLVGAGGGKGFPSRSMTSADPLGNALKHLLDAPVRFDAGWRLSELRFRVFFRGEKKRRPQVTVTLRPERVLQYRSAEHERRILDLLDRNGLTNERDDLPTLAAAE
ncbi:MAG: hypothetical protein KDA73_19700 [Rhodobacteraceae bacterium]|nr:hypothetical protein [Paracoccaceae bacterium]